MNKIEDQGSAALDPGAESVAARGIRIVLLGEFRLEAGGVDLTAELGRKERALLAYLALQPDGRAGREVLARLLWGGRDESARQSLRQALSGARKVLAGLGIAALDADRVSVSLIAGEVSCDAWDFAACEARGDASSRRAAAALWRGQTLEGVEVSTPAFNDWLTDRRRQWEHRALRLFSAALDDADAAAHHVWLTAHADRRLAADPLDEEAHRLRLRLLAALAFVIWRPAGESSYAPPEFAFAVPPLMASVEDAETAFALRQTIATALTMMPSTALAESDDAGVLKLEGGIQHVAAGREVALRLIDRRNGELLWGERLLLNDPEEVTSAGEALVLRMTAGLRNLLKERLPPVPPTPPDLETRLNEARQVLSGGYTRRKIDQALEICRGALEDYPDHHRLQADIASLLASRLSDRWSDDREADTREALDRIERALAVNPTQDKAIFTLGLIRKTQRNFQQARMLWRLALEFDPRIEAAYGQIAQASIYLGDAPGGLDYALRAIRMNPRARSVDRNYFYAGMASFLLGDEAAAVTYIDNAVAIRANRPDLFAWRAAALAHLGRLDEARRDIDRLRRDWPDWRVDHHLLQVHDSSRMKRLEDGLGLAGWGVGR